MTDLWCPGCKQPWVPWRCAEGANEQCGTCYESHPVRGTQAEMLLILEREAQEFRELVRPFAQACELPAVGPNVTVLAPTSSWDGSARSLSLALESWIYQEPHAVLTTPELYRYFRFFDRNWYSSENHSRAKLGLGGWFLDYYYRVPVIIRPSLPEDETQMVHVKESRIFVQGLPFSRSDRDPSKQE